MSREDQEQASKGKSPVLSGSLWMIGTVLSLSSIAIAARELSPAVSTYEMVFFRALFSMMILLPFVSRQQKSIPTTRHPGKHLVRNISHYIAQLAWFYGITLLPLAKVFAIEFTTPIWTLLLASIMLGERITTWKLVALVLGLLGVLIVLRPGLVPINSASIAVLCCAFFFALSHIFTSKLTVEESPLQILFFMALVQIPLALPLAVYTWVTPMGVAWLWLLLLALLSLSAHYCLSRALTIADASLMIPLDFLRLPFIMIVAFLFYQEALDLFVLLGALVIFTGNFLNVRHEHKSHVRGR